MIQNILNYQAGGAPLHITALNAGAALYVAGKAESLMAGTMKALETIKNGSAKEQLARLKQKRKRKRSMLNQIIARKEHVQTLQLPEEGHYERQSFKEALMNPHRSIGLIAEVKKRLLPKASFSLILILYRQQKHTKHQMQIVYLS